jgi:O-antigen/teichoic acid export membrane protein
MLNEATKDRARDQSSGDEELESSAHQAAAHSRRVLPKLRRSAVWMLVGNMAFSAARWAIFVILARLGSDPRIVGEYKWATAFCLPTIAICRFGLRTLVTTDARREHRFAEYLAFALVSTSIAAVIISGLAYWHCQTPTGFDTYTALLILIVGAWNAIESISEAFLGLFQQREHMECVAVSYTIQAVMMCLFLGIGMYFTGNLLVGAAGLAAASAIRLCAYEMPMAYHLLTIARAPGGKGKRSIKKLSESLWPHIGSKATRQLFIAGAPLAILSFIMTYTESVPSYVLEDTLGKSRLGTFAVLYSLANAQGLFVLSLAQSVSARLAVFHVQRNRAAFIRTLVQALSIAALCGCVSLAIVFMYGAELLTLVYGAKYAADVKCFQILMISGTLFAMGYVLGTAVTSARNFAAQVPLHLIRLAIIGLGTSWAAPRYGLDGVAWVIVAGAAILISCYSVMVALQVRRLNS